MGVPSIEDVKTDTCSLSPKIYQNSIGDMDYASEYTRKKKMFSSSSFYEEPNAIYPSIEEQVELCRKIADSLSDECNLKSKGANMFFKRVKRAEKWIVAESKENQQNETTSSIDPLKMPYVRPRTKGLPKLKLLLDPRHVLDIKLLQKEGVDIVEHNTVSPEICQNIVRDLNSPTGKGAQLFAKRKKKSAEWVVDEEKVKALLENRYHDAYSSPPEPTIERIKPFSWHNTPQIKKDDVAETVIRAAEAKIMTYSTLPQVPIIEPLYQTEQTQKKVSFADSPSTPSLYQKSSCLNDAYKYRVPRGWPSKMTDSLPSSTEKVNTSNGPLSPKGSPLQRAYSFTNFNATPRAWSPDLRLRDARIKPVRPPSLLAQ